MSSNDDKRRAASSFNSRRSQQSMDSLSSNTLLTQSTAINLLSQENKLGKSTDVLGVGDTSTALQTFHQSEEKSFIKVGDLVYFLSDENIAIFGEGVGTLFGRKNDESLKTDFLGAIFRVQPKYEYGAQAELNKYVNSKSPDADKLEKLEENVENEKRRNSEEERVLGGSVVYYGQLVQLVHFATNMVLSGDKKSRSDLDPGSLKLELRKEASKNSWFKIMPRYKVRFEGEEIRQFDKICLIHVKSGMFVHLSDKTYEDNEYNEVHMNSTLTSWTVSHFMSFQPQSEQYIKAGDVVRIFHQEKEGFLKANITPLFNDNHYDLFLKVKGKKGNAMESKSSNTLFLIELKQNVGGMIAWRTEVRLKHLGTGKYLAINYKARDTTKLNLILTYDLKTYEEETLFIFNPVDPGTNFISFGTYCRIQGKKIGDKKPHWLHVGEFIENKTPDLGGKEEDDNNPMSFARNKFLELQFTEKFHYEDAVLFKPVKPIEIEELNYVNSLYAVLIEFAKKLKGSLTDSNGNASFQTTIKKSRTNVGILPIDTDPVKDTLRKLVAFVNKSDEADALKQDGIPILAHQTLLFEQQMIEASIDILIHIFGFTTKSYGTVADINPETKEQFAQQIGKKDNKHILELITLIYKFLQMIVKENHKLGMHVSQWMNIFLTHMGTGVGVRKTLIELFKDNKTLLETVPTKTIDAFVQLLLEVGKDAKLLEFLVAICTCDDSPVLRNQMYILDCLHKNPQLLFATRTTKDGKYEINVGVKEDVWILFEEFVKAKVYKKKTVSEGTKADEAKQAEEEKKSQYEYSYNTRYMKEIDYFKQLLQLYYRVCLANDKAVLFLSEGDPSSKIPPLMTSDMVFACLRNDNLPGSMRSFFCDLLYLWIDKDLPASPNAGVKYTWSWDEIVQDYVVKRTSEDSKDTKNSWTTKNLTELQHFLFQFLQKNQDLAVGDKENRQLLLSVLVVVSKMVNYGFFIESKDQESLVPVLLQIVNGKTEVTPQSTKFSRFEMTESNWPLIKTKVQVCKILHSFYDVRLEKKTAEQLYKYKSFYDEQAKEPKKKANLGLLALSASAASEEEKSDDPNEIALKSITYQPVYDEKLRSILLDTSLYQYEPLTTSALSLLLRHMRNRDELISTLERVQLLTDEESVRLYHHISGQLGKLQQILEDNDISEDDSPLIIAILKDFIKKCCVEEDMNKPNPKTQTLFRNLNVHNEVLRVLKLRYRDDYHYIFKLCYLFLKMFVQNNKTNQELLFPLLDFMLSQMGMQLNIADTLTALVKENYNICNQLDSFFIGHMTKLLYAKGHKPRYVHLLDAIVCAEDKTIKENQTTVATLILAKREYILTNYHELKKKALDGSSSNLAAVASNSSSKQEATKEDKDELFKKRAKLARINTTLATMTEGLDFKIDLDTYELINATKVTKDEDELLYHVAIIDLLGKTCKDKNHATEALCQALFTVPDIVRIIRDSEAGPLVKGAYTRFLSEVWLFTERPLNLHLDEQIWDLVRFYREDIRKFKKMSPMDNNYIFEGVLFVLRTFFSCDFPDNLSSERVATCNDLLGALVDMLAKFKNDSHKILSIINTILQITSSNIKGINSTIGTEKINDIIEKSRKSMGTMGHKTMKNFKRELLEEKRKVAYLKLYVKKLSEEKAVGSRRTVLVEEFDKIVRLFKDKLMKKKNKVDAKDAGHGSFLKRKGAQYVQKLIMQLQSDEEDKKLAIDCLSILIAIIELEDAPIQKMSVKKLGKTLVELKEADKKKLQLMWREKVQNRLGELGAMKEAIALLNSTSAALIYNALTLCCSMLAGGNRKIQEMMMAVFLSTPDPHFFDDIRSRIAGAVTELKNKRRQANTVKRRNISSQGSMMLDEEELDEIFDLGISKKEDEGDNIQKLLLFMQNLCEGHYTEMKEYLREQWDNTKSFNLVKECVSLATELERGVEEHWGLANQLFRTLNEFASGCPGNQVTITEAKIYVPFNRIFTRIPACNDENVLELKNSMLELMLSLVEGMFPQKETATSFVPEILMESVDFNALETSMENGLKFSEVRTEFEVLQLKLERRQKMMQQQLMKSVAALGDSQHQEPRSSVDQIPPKERAETPEESQKAKEVVSKCLILMQILAQYDEDKKTQAKAILKKTQWANYSQENIGNIEVLNDSGELEQVYFTIPPVCHNLQAATKDEFLKVVKRESPTDKIDDFVRRSGTLQYEIYHHTKLAESRVHFLSSLYTPIRNLLLLITVIVNGLMIGLYDGETLQYSEYTRYIFYGLCGLHLLISTAWVGVYMWMWAPVIIFRRVQDRKEEVREANILLKKEGKKLHSTEISWFRKLTFLFTDGLLVYHFLFWFFSIVSIPYFPVMAFHMIDLSVRSDGVINVVKAVTTNGRSLILTAVLLINLIYIYTVIGYFGLPSAYVSNNCENLYVCILYNINAGIRNGGGIGDVLGDVAPGDSTYIGRFFFDLTFFLVIIILGLNIVFGIILDTFGQLRDQKSFIEEDMRSKCFICGIDSDTFQRQALGFKHHIKHDHNMWSYLYFFIYLDEKDQDEYSYIEEYVAEKRKAGENDYFPIAKAICLTSKKKKKGG